jgi:hypothetical protein
MFRKFRIKILRSNLEFLQRKLSLIKYKIEYYQAAHEAVQRKASCCNEDFFGQSIEAYYSLYFKLDRTLTRLKLKRNKLKKEVELREAKINYLTD